MRARTILPLALGVLSAIAWGTSAAADVSFTEVTDTALDAPFVHAGASVDLFPFAPLPGEPAALGWLGGVALADFNGDGWNDLFATNGRGGANALYLNRADGTLRFQEVAAVAGVAFPADEAAAAVAGDLDNDGDTDLYIANVGLGFGPPPVRQAGPNRLLLNQGNDADGVPMFVDATIGADAGGDPFTRSQLPSLVDFDRDGDLDIYVGAHNPVVNPAFAADDPAYPNKRPPSQTALLLRSLLVETGSLLFEDATDLLRHEVSGTLGRDGRPIFDSRFTFDGVWVDVDGDGWPDLLQANDLGVLGLFRNLEGQAFRYASPEAGLDEIGAWMSLSPGDVNGDGHPDFFASNVGEAAALPTFTNPRHALYLNDGHGRFTDVADATGVADPPQDGDASGDFGWGGQLFDADNDGDLDLFFLGNWWSQGIGLPGGLIPHVNRGHFFENRSTRAGAAPGRLVLEDRMATAAGRASLGIDNPADGRSVVTGDLDNDGFPDLVIGNMSGRATLGRIGGFASAGLYEGGVRIFRNQGNDHRALVVRLEGTASNRDGIGARVTVVAQGRPQVREVRAGDGHLASRPPEQIFGLGDARAVGLIRVEWPSGTVQTLAGVPLTEPVTRITLTEP